MTAKEGNKIKRAFDYSRFDNIDVSDDENTFHPNIEKNFNVKINRTVRDRKINETEEEIQELTKRKQEIEKKIKREEDAKKTAMLHGITSSGGSSSSTAAAAPGGGNGSGGKTTTTTSSSSASNDITTISKIQQRIDELEKSRIWHAGNMCELKEEKTIVNTYGNRDPKKEIIPGKDEGMNSDKDVEEYMRFKEANKVLLNKFVDCASLDASEGGKMEKSKKMMIEHGEILLHNNHTSTFLLLSCLEYEMDNKREEMMKCAIQSQCLAHIRELAVSLNRPPRDLVIRWFDAIQQKTEAHKTWKSDVEGFAVRVQGRAVEKRKEEEVEKKRQKELQEKYLAKKEEKRQEKRKERIAKGEDPDGGDNEDNNDDDSDIEEIDVSEDAEERRKLRDGEAEVKTYYKRADEVAHDNEEIREAVPLVKAMKDMTKEERIAMAPGGLDPLEVFESLPAEMRDCFERQDVPALIELQKSMPANIFNPALVRCIKAGLWSQPLGDDEEEEEGPGSESAGGGPNIGDQD